MAELNVQQKNIVNQLRQAYPELKSYSDEQILSLYNQQLNNIQLSEAEKISIMNGKNGVVNDGMGIQLETSQKAVSKEQESQLKSALTARLNAVSTNVKKAEDSNGFLGKAWSWTKNTFNFGDSSDKVREQQKADLKALESGNIAEAFKKITGLDYTIENVNKFLNNEVQTRSETALNGYTEGQEMASDITADIISGIAAVGIYTAAVAAAPFTGGASIVVGVAAAGASAAAIKTGIKYADAKSGGREYTADNLKKDLATGAFSGVLAPITGGMGGAVGKTAAKALGIQAVKQVGKEVAEEAVEQTAKGFVKTMLTNPTGYEYIGGNMVKRGLAFAAEAATDGAIGGAVDNAFRTAYDGGSLEDIGNSAVEGFVGGAIMSPVIGGGMKVAGKGAQKIFGKNNVDIDANGNRVRVNDDGTVVRIDENGNEIPASATDAEIHIPKGVLASDIAPFIETDDGFRNIARNRARDIAELDKIKDVDEFLEKSFSMIKEEMGLADSPIKFEITNGDNQYDLETNTVSINPNWANGDKAELFGAIAHELDHFLQWKAVMRNVDENHPMYKAVYDQLTLTKVGYDNLSYILFKNEAPATELLKKQAKEYADNWQNYIEPADPKTGKVDITSEQYKRYKEQPVEAEAMRRGEIVVEEYRRAISGNNSPSGTIADKSELYQRALSENPAEVVADKVYREWTTADVNTRVADEPVDLFNLDPYAGLKQSAPEVNGEVTSLIFTGKLKQKLTQRYVDLENTFKDIAKRRSSDIKALANACGNDRDKFANGLVEMLCEDLGMKGIAPQVKFIDINRGTVRGQANYFSGCIQIDSQVRTANELVDIVSHELTHMMQFKDILVQYGEKGIRELIKNTPDNLKERDFNAILNNPFTQKILQNIDSFKQDDVGSLNEFIKRIYKEELATGVDSQKNPEIYFNQLLEREAYHLASEQIGKGVHSVDDVYFDEFNFAWDPVTGQFNMPSGVLPTSNNYLQRIQRVHFSTNGGLKTSEVKVYESFRRAMHKVLIATNGNAELPDNIYFREIPDHINGIACKDAATQSISINRCFLDNLDSSISKCIKGLQDVEMLKVDADGKIHISDFLRNDLTIEFEKKLNAYNESLSLADKLELYTQMGYFINLQNQARTNPIVTIEKIMVTGDNQAVLKKRGLFKSRDEVASMTAKEQVAYLKEIALITKIPEDAVLIRDVDQIFTHEIGHLNHKLTPADESYLTSKAVIDEHRNNVTIQNTCSKVTQYAKESPKEFVAEVYSGLINGQKFDDDVMALYRKYKGPEVENATRANLPAGVVVRDEIGIKVESLSKIIQDKEVLEIRLKELFGMAENEKLRDMYDFQLKEIVSIIDKENIVLLESILKRNDIQTWDVQDLLKSCCNNSEKANKLKHLLSLKRQEENVFKAYTCTTLIENDYDEALLNKMLLKEVNGNYKYDGDYISQALQLCTGSKEKTWAMNQIIEKDFNIYSYNLNEWLSLISPENMGIILYLKEIKLNDFDLQECLKFCKSTEEQLPKLQEINTRIDISGPQKLEMIKNSLKNSELTELLYKDSRFLEDSWTTTAIISKYDSAKEMVDFLLRQKNIDNPEFLKYNPSEILDFINSSLTISDLTPATLKMIDDIKALKFEGEQLFSKPVTFIETLKNNKEYEFIWTDILQNIKNGNLQLENGIFVKNIIENFKNIPENYQTKILNLFLGENKKLSVYNLSKIISANQKDNIFNNPFKLKVFDDLLTRIQKEDFENTKDLNCIDELLSSILGPTQVNWYLKLIEFNQKNNSRFSLNDINEIIKKCHSIDEESFDRFVNYKETDGITPRFTGSEISNLLNYSGFWLNKFETVAGLKNSDGTYKFNGEAIYALLRLGDRTKESGIYDKLLSIEVEGKAKFQGKSCEDLLNLTFQLRKDARELLLDLMENQNISEKVLLKIFEADYPGGPILVKDIPWEEFAKYGLLENSNGEVNHKLIQTLKYYWSGDTSYVEKMMSMTSQSLETMNYMKNISKEGLNEVSWYKQILEKADKMTDAEIKFYFDFGKQAIYDNYHGRWSELNDNKINVTNNFLSSLLDSKTVLTLDSFSISEKITLLNYLKDINIADFKSPNSFSAFLQKFSSTDELKRHIMKDLEVSLKQPGKDIIISQGHINKLLKGEFSGLKEKYPFITNDVIAKYNKIMLKTNNLEGLTSKDQVVLKFAVLFEKINGDEILNSIIARNILENNGMTADISERVFNLLKNKNWLTMYKEGKLDINDIAVLFREPNDLEIAKLLCAEDFLNETNRSIIKEVETTLNNIYSTAPIVKPTTIPYEQRYLTRLLYEDTEYKIIDFTDPNLNLSALGFSKELNSENIRFLTHFINIEGQDSRMSGSSTELINLLCDEMNNTSLSVALINPNHIDIDVMGRNCAVILEPMGSNYAAAFHEDFTSPLKKGFQEFKEYLTGKLTPEKRVYISNVYKKLLNLNDSEYVEFYKALSGLKDISNIKSDITINKGLSTERVIPKEEVISAINSAHNSLTNVTGNWNELIIYNPKIKALLYKIETDVQDNLLENCPKDILDFAKKHNIPIVITK